MTIGLLQLHFLIPGARSLKDKRRAISSLKTLLGNRFNCSVAEVGDKEKWGRAHLAVCVVSDSSPHVNDQLNEIAKFANNHHAAQLVDFDMEML